MFLKRCKTAILCWCLWKLCILCFFGGGFREKVCQVRQVGQVRQVRRDTQDHLGQVRQVSQDTLDHVGQVRQVGQVVKCVKEESLG